MAKLVTTCLFVAATTLAANARIGETLDESIKRYGDVVETRTYPGGNTWHLFRKGDFVISIFLGKDGKTEAIEYLKDPVKNSGFLSVDSEMSSNEIQNFLNAEGSGWVDLEANIFKKLHTEWDNGSLYATYKFWSRQEDEPAHYALRIETRGYSEMMRKKQIEAENKNQEGF